MKKGDLVLLEAMGGGFTWGSALCAGKRFVKMSIGFTAIFHATA